DAVFVGQWCNGNINTLVHVLECFYRASGLRINLSKSKIIGVHVEDEKVKHATSKLGCLILNSLFSYLGIKVRGSMSRVQAWKEVVDKVGVVFGELEGVLGGFNSEVKIDALPTRLNISRRGIDIDTISCPICDCVVESSNHLFFSCSLARQIARKISLWWNVNYVDVNSYVEWLNWLVSLRLTAKLKVMIEGVFYAMWWYLWPYRNKFLFETKVPLKAVIFDDVVSSSFYCCRFRCKASFSWDD
nr:RNA-directed DNA polymerase, eukaryota [Tanacetum cinerariifolium]